MPPDGAYNLAVGIHYTDTCELRLFGDALQLCIGEAIKLTSRR